jgi:hypothetical protein
MTRLSPEGQTKLVKSLVANLEAFKAASTIGIDMRKVFIISREELRCIDTVIQTVKDFI